MTIKRLYCTLVACLAFISFNVSSAIISFDDDTESQDGTISYDGAGGALVGSGIDFHSILGISTPSNPGSVNSLTCVNCTLSFTTGTNISEGPTLWQFGGGGSLTITGTAQTSDSTPIVIASGTLVEGSFDSATVTGNSSLLIMSGFGVDDKNTGLIDYFGLGGYDFIFADTNISMEGVTIDGNSGFSGTVTNADFDNTAVPVPAAVWLFGSGLLGLVGVARRKKA